MKNFNVLGTAYPYKDIDYFGHKLSVPHDTLAVATDKDGDVHAFYCKCPNAIEYAEAQNSHADHWSNGAVVLKTLITHINYDGNWLESLMVLK